MLYIDFNGGNSSQNFEKRYSIGEKLILEYPTKEGDAFAGWTVEGKGSAINENEFTMGKVDSTIRANWLSDIFEYKLADGNDGILGNHYAIEDEENGTWKIKFLKDGIFTPLKDMQIDVFLVGGGGGGGASSTISTAGAKGGSGIVIIRNARQNNKN